MDDFCAKFVDAPDTREARGWLNEGNNSDLRTLSEHESTEESLALVEQLYAAGAIKVLAVEIYVYDIGQNSGKLVVELPSGAAARAAVLKILNQISTSLGFDAEKDVGQSLTFVMLD